MAIDAESYRHPREKQAEDALVKLVASVRATILQYHRDYVLARKTPGLYGAAVRVSPRQFPRAYEVLTQCSSALGLDGVPMFVRPAAPYGAHVDGLETRPWIEIGGGAHDAPGPEMVFLIGSQLAHVHCRHQTAKVLMDQALELSEMLHSVPGVNLADAVGGVRALQTTLRLVSSRWSRLSTYTADACGYLLCGDLGASVRAMLKCAFGGAPSVSDINVPEFLKQAVDVDAQDSVVNNYVKLGEPVPYAPVRAKELLRFASSKRGKQALSDIRRTSSAPRR